MSTPVYLLVREFEPIEGTIIRLRSVPDKPWPNGDARNAIEVTLSTADRLTDVPGDDGVRVLRFTSPSLCGAIKRALEKVGAGHLEVGGVLSVDLSGVMDEATLSFSSTQLEWDVKYTRPTPGPTFTSPMERLFWETCQESGYPIWAEMTRQERVGRYFLDFAFPKDKLGIEIDGFDFHSTREQLISDRRRQREIEQQGWKIIRFAGSEIKRDPVQCDAEVVEALYTMRGTPEGEK